MGSSFSLRRNVQRVGYVPHCAVARAADPPTCGFFFAKCPTTPGSEPQVRYCQDHHYRGDRFSGDHRNRNTRERLSARTQGFPKSRFGKRDNTMPQKVTPEDGSDALPLPAVTTAYQDACGTSSSYPIFQAAASHPIRYKHRDLPGAGSVTEQVAPRRRPHARAFPHFPVQSRFLGGAADRRRQHGRHRFAACGDRLRERRRARGVCVGNARQERGRPRKLLVYQAPLHFLHL